MFKLQSSESRKQVKHFLHAQFVRVRQIFTIIVFLTSLFGINTFPVNAANVLRQSALVLTNTQSADYADFQHFIQPYLDHFGIPYTTLDISTAPVTADVAEYALLVIGHRNFDSGMSRYLDSTEEGFISAAVNAGSGLINFDNALSADGSTARYQFVNDVFTFGYNNSTSGTDVTFANPTLNYIIQNHTLGQTITTNAMNLAGITLPGDVTSLASSGTQTFIAVTTYGLGRGVQFGSYDWISRSVKGPLFGLDDLFWRSMVWAARKPFVMQGLPPFVTMRMDDVSGPLWWIHAANDYGFIPWAGVFTADIDSTEAADLSALVNSGKATSTIHAFENGTNRFFYYDHNNGQDFSDTVVTNNFTEATQWFTSRNIPIGKYATPHFYEVGSNVFDKLNTWGVKYISTVMNPGQSEATAPWMMAGPFRLYETGNAKDINQNVYYADYIPGYPGFFNCITEIRDVTGYEWLGNGRTSVSIAIADGTEWLKRSLNSMAVADLFSHEYTFIGSMPESDWRTVMAGVTQSVASYNPIYVSRDYACAYARAVHDSNISGGIYNPATKSIAVDLNGTTDMPTKFYIFREDGGQIVQQLVDVPTFSGTTQVNYNIPGPLDHITVSPNPAEVIAGTTQQFTAIGYDAENNPISGLPITWSVVNGGGTINATGLFTAGATTGIYTNTVQGMSGLVIGTATVNVIATSLDHFFFETINSPQYAGFPFSVTIRARDAANNPVLTYNGTAKLGINAGTVTPTLIRFTNGVWTGAVTIPTQSAGLTLNIQDGSATATSNVFDVTAPPVCPCSIWNETGTPSSLNESDTNPIQLGTKFRSSINGYITGIKFYKGDLNTGTHTGQLYAMDGILLASVVFSNETASGWQTTYFATPVQITAGTTYIAAYHSGSGYYAFTQNYFGSAVNNPPLTALADGTDGANGVYKYSATPSFPNATFNKSNYWVDAVFETSVAPDITSPVVETVVPASGATTANIATAVTAKFNEAMDPLSLNAGNFELRDTVANTVVAATVSYDAGTLIATLTPSAALTPGTQYTAKLKGGSGGVSDIAGNPLTADYIWSFTTLANNCPCSIWGNTGTPASAPINDSQPIEVGTKFRSDTAGYITSLRFYKGAGDTDTHVGHLWASTGGSPLATVTFTNETASGWQVMALSAPVQITANTTYIVSIYSAPVGNFAYTPGGLTSAVDNPPLHALAFGVDGPNGVYAYGGGFPANGSNANYWVDVVFDTTISIDTTPPTITGRVPAANATEVARDTNVTVTFSEAMNPATLTDTTFTLRASGSGSDVPAVVSYAAGVATLNPSTNLELGKVYQVTVSGTVTDLAGNPLGSNDTWSFTTTSQEVLTDTSVVNFNAGTVGACYVDNTVGDGALRLPSVFYEDFLGSTLPAGWSWAPWSGGTASVGSGSLSVNGAIAGTNSIYTAGRSLEFVATFTGEQFQHVGFVESLAFNGPWAIFSTKDTTANLYARSSTGGDTLIPGNYLNAPHLYRIDWSGTAIKYYIDGNLVVTHNTSIATPMVVAASDANLNANALSVDWLRISPPFGSSCVFESRIFDAGSIVKWNTLTSTGTTPVGTSVSYDVRTGNSASPDISWTNWQVASSPLTNPGSQYLQYRATLSTTDTSQTPEVAQVALSYTQKDFALLTAPSGSLSNWDRTFSWTGFSASTWYRLEVYTSAGALVLQKWYTNVQAGCSVGTSCAVSPVETQNLANGDYKWTILDYGDSYGYGGWPAFKSFTLNGACYALTTNVLPVGSGTINVPAQNCSGGYTAGSVVQLSAVPNTGYTFNNWSGDAVGTTNVVTVTMNGAKTVTGNFAELAPSGTLTSWDHNFRWPSVPNATWYYLDVSTAGGSSVLLKWFSSAEAGCSVGTSCAVSPVETQNLVNGDYKWRILDWGGYGAGSWSAYTPFTLSGACYALTTNVLPVSSGTINVPAQNCSGGYTAGSVVQLSAIPNPGYAFNNWSGDVVGTTNVVSVTMTGPRTVTANFGELAPAGTLTNWDHNFRWPSVPNATWYYLDVSTAGGSSVLLKWFSSAEAGCSVGTSCAVLPVETQNLANGDYKWRILDWGGYGAGSWTAYRPFTLSGACYALTMNVLPVGSGTINAPAQNCSGGYTAGSVVQLSAVPNTGYTFNNWSGDAVGTTNPVTVTMTGPRTVTANYKQATALIAPSGLLGSWNNVFSWTGISVADWYLVEVETSGGTPVLSRWYTVAEGCSGGTSCAVSPVEMQNLASGAYKWRILDWGPYGIGTWTPFMNFTVP